MFRNTVHAFKIALLTFVITLIISLGFRFSFALWISLTSLFLVTLTGILFDIIGTAVTAAKEAPFHAMSADKVKGSREAIYLIRYADQVANFCNDVIGDIAGTVSGAIVVSIILQIMGGEHVFHEELFNAAAIAFIAAFTVGGKALGKSYALGQPNKILFTVGKILFWFKLINPDLKKAKRKNKTTRKVRR